MLLKFQNQTLAGFHPRSVVTQLIFKEDKAFLECRDIIYIPDFRPKEEITQYKINYGKRYYFEIVKQGTNKINKEDELFLTTEIIHMLNPKCNKRLGKFHLKEFK